jgi:acetylornithine deacetylase/succinyl-diaminopimelate desuccinylase-like protein
VGISLDFIEACRKLIEIDSSPDLGTNDVVKYAAALCRDAGLHVEIQQETHNGVDQANLIARPVANRPDDELLLQTHLDTCDPGNYGFWTKTGSNPYNASIYLDTLYGLGSASAKLDFLCKLKAASELQGSNWRFPYVLVGTFGEELGMPGAIKLIRKKKIISQAA